MGREGKNFYIAAICVFLSIIMSACNLGYVEDKSATDDVLAAVDDIEEVVEEFCEEIEEEIEEELEDEIQYSEEDLVEFEPEQAFMYCSNVQCQYTDDQIQLSLSFNNGIPISDDDNVYLLELDSYENEGALQEKEPIAWATKNFDVVIDIPYKDKRLFSRFAPAILYDGVYVPISYSQYITNPEALANNNNQYLQMDSKKGLLLDANTIDSDKLYDLNVKRLVYNMPLSLIIGESDNETYPTIDYEYNGKIYHFNGYQLAGFDSLFSYLNKQGYHSTIIILNDWNDEYQEIIHPASRNKTRKSLYYAFNTEEEAGTCLMEATALFLAERYLNNDYGMIYDWVIANEVNQQTIWNYMDTDNLYYYAESFERSFRTFYNAIKSNYSNAKVYYSIDHDWNDNYGNNRRFFNGKDFLYTFNEIAKARGDYDWGLSIHPYPDPLPKVRFWQGKVDKSEDAKVITPMNLSVLTDVMTKEEFLDTKGCVRDIAVTELGFSSKAGERVHAAAFAYCYYIIENNPYINSFLLNRQTDDTAALKSGLALGIYNNDYSEKYIANVFRNIDTQEGEGYIEEMLNIIGASSIEEALEWAE